MVIQFLSVLGPLAMLTVAAVHLLNSDAVTFACGLMVGVIVAIPVAHWGFK